ncbi:MAG: flagellar hook-length control protein FliK [Anaerocolumna sp.]
MLNNKISQSTINRNGSMNSTVPAPVNPNPSSSVNSTAGLEKGQLIRGEVTDLRSNEVSVKLEDGRMLSGKIEESGNLAIGDKVVFRVEDVSLKSLTLKIIANSDFTSGENTIEKALEAAGLSKNSRNSSIVRELLNQQMSIDKKTISLLIQQSVLHKETPIETLVLMNKYHVPVNESNIRQFIAYQHSEHSILNEIGSLADSITDLFRPNGDMPGSEYLTHSSDLLNLLLSRSGEVLDNVVSNPMSAVLTPGDLNQTDLNQSGLNQTDSITAHGSLGNKDNLTTGNFLSQSDALKLVTILESDTMTKSLLGSEFLSSLSDGSADLREAAQTLNNLLTNTGSAALSPEMMEKLQSSPELQTILSADGGLMYANNEIGSSLNLSDRLNLANSMESFIQTDKPNLSPAGESISLLKDRIVAGTVSTGDILKWVHDNLNKANEASANTLLSSKEFKLLLKENLLNKWTMDPQAITKSEDINRHFEGLLNQINDLKDYMEQSATASNSNIGGQVNHLNENINFMNTLNEFFNYVQLPLKFKNQFANSELYVYSRKKSGRTANDGISVLLHLDMAHLGPLDVFLDLHDKQLISKFYLDNTDVIKLITSNMYLLGDTLNAKGYTFNTEILPREKTVNVVDDFLKDDTQPASLTRYNFDLRA